MKPVSFEDFLHTLPMQIPILDEHPLDHALRLERPHGTLLEFGVYNGSSIRKIAASTEGCVYGFDSFEGLPESWARPDAQLDAGSFSTHKVLPHVPSNVHLVVGWFEDTLPRFVKETLGEKIGFMHVDCDLYSSTKTVFDHVAPLVQKGTIIVFDELLNYPTYEHHEVKAFYEFLSSSEYDVEWIGKIGAVDLHPTKDNGYIDQPVACRLI